MKHRWLVYSLIACGLALVTAANGPLWVHGAVFMVGLLCFFRWIEALDE